MNSNKFSSAISRPATHIYHRCQIITLHPYGSLQNMSMPDLHHNSSSNLSHKQWPDNLLSLHLIILRHYQSTLPRCDKCKTSSHSSSKDRNKTLSFMDDRLPPVQRRSTHHNLFSQMTTMAGISTIAHYQWNRPCKLVRPLDEPM